MSANRTNDKKKAFLKALQNCAGNITKACEKVGIARITHYAWLEKDEQYKASYEAFEESLIDNTESKLHELINGVSMFGKDGEVYLQPPHATAIIFHLKTKAKKRGYVERQEIEHKTDKPFIIELSEADSKTD